MEEKIYFKPEGYGKGKKKAEKIEPKEKGNHKVAKLVGILIFLFIVIAIIIWLLRGKTTTTTEKIPNVASASVVCSSKSFKYPIFTYDGAKSRELDIKMVFTEEKLKSISLDYSLFYDSADLIRGSEAHNHADMNISFGKAGLPADAYDAKYSILTDRVRMSLYATENKLDEVAKTYFLITGDGTFPITTKELHKNYEAQGFTCETSK